MSSTAPSSRPEPSSMEQHELNGAPPTADAPAATQLTESEPPTKVEASTEDDSTQEQDESSHEKAQLSQLRKGMAAWQWTLFHVIVFFGAAISGYDVSNVATIQVSVYEDFGQIDLLPWISTAFSLGNAATSPLLDQIMKLVDLKWFMLGCWVLFLAATAATGASPTIEGVIVGRTILGIAGGGIYLALLVYISLMAGPSEHSRVIGLLGMGFAVGLIGGPLIGGAFAANENATWRWAFYICLPYAAVMMLLVFLACPRARLRPQEDIGLGLRKIDWIGAFLHVTTLVLFDAACIFSGGTLAWRSGGVIALWVLFGLFAIIYAVQQRYSLFTEPSKRILPIAVLSTRTGFLVMLNTFWSTGGYGVALYYLPLFYAFTRGDDSLQTAVHMLPYICVYIAGAIGSGIVLPIVRRYAVLYLVGGVLIAAGAASMQTVDADTPLRQTMGIGALLGFGIGLTMQLGASVLALALPANIRMDGAITMTLTVYTGTTVALAVAGCIHQNIGFAFLSDALREWHLSSAQLREALAGVGSSLSTKLPREAVEAAIAAVTSAIIRIFYISTAAGALMVLCSLAMKWEALEFKPRKAKKIEEA